MNYLPRYPPDIEQQRLEKIMAEIQNNQNGKCGGIKEQKWHI